MNRMQEDVRAFCAAHGLTLGVQARYIDLVSEVGELGKSLLKATAYESQPPTYAEETTLELGDCLFSLLALSESLGIDVESALESALSKYRARFARKGDIGS